MRRSLLTGLAAVALLAAPGLAVAQEPAGGETFVSLGWVTIPGAPLTSFDISWVDTDLNLYFLADRSNAAVDVFAVKLNPGVFNISSVCPQSIRRQRPDVPNCECLQRPQWRSHPHQSHRHGQRTLGRGWADHDSRLGESRLSHDLQHGEGL